MSLSTTRRGAGRPTEQRTVPHDTTAHAKRGTHGRSEGDARTDQARALRVTSLDDTRGVAAFRFAPALGDVHDGHACNRANKGRLRRRHWIMEDVYCFVSFDTPVRGMQVSPSLVDALESRCRLIVSLADKVCWNVFQTHQIQSTYYHQDAGFIVTVWRLSLPSQTACQS